MSKLKNLLGMKFGRLTVIARAENAKNGSARWIARCDCGNETIVRADCLTRGIIQSCRCLSKELSSRRQATHKKSHSKIYQTWADIKDRCLNPLCKDYKRYGGRGIKICAEWINDFQAFYEYVSQLEHFGEEGYSLDRIDNNGNYEPGNVRFATAKEQVRNRRTSIYVEYNGVEMALIEAAKVSWINYNTLRDRYARGDRGEYLFRAVKH